MTGRGEGCCALVLPEAGQVPYGYAGLQGSPVRQAPPALGTSVGRQPRPVIRRGRALRRRRGRGAGRRGGRKLTRW